MTAKICGAKNRKGGVCQQKPMKNGRCRFHGGKSTGVKGNQNARKHGAYSKFFSQQELEYLDEIGTKDSLESELKLCQIQLMRALQAQAEQLKAGETEKLELIAQTMQAVKDGEQLQRQQINKSFAKTDFVAIIDRLIGRIQSLMHSLQDMESKRIDIELKSIELNGIKSAHDDAQNQPIQVIIDVKDGRKHHTQSEQETS